MHWVIQEKLFKPENYRLLTHALDHLGRGMLKQFNKHMRSRDNTNDTLSCALLISNNDCVDEISSEQYQHL